MAILWCRRKVGIGTGIDDRGQQTFKTGYTAKSDQPRESRDVVLASDLVPHYGAGHPENPLAVCVRVTADQNKEHPYLWDIVAEWAYNPASKRDPADQQKQPDERRPKWSCRFVEIPAQRFTDLGHPAKPLASTAGQPFDPVPDIPIIADEIIVVRYERECKRGSQRQYMDKSNIGAWFGALPGTALMQNITVQEEYLQGTYWFLTTYTILIKPRIEITLPLGKKQNIGGFDPEYICNLGTLAKKNVDGKLKVVPILREDPLNADKKWYDGRPAYLDANGFELPRDPDSGIYTADPVFLEFTMKPRVSFDPLGLDPPPGMKGE